MNTVGGSAATFRLREIFEALWHRLDSEPTAVDGGWSTAELQIETPQGHLRLGRDATGTRHLLVPVGAGDRVEEDRRSAGIHLATRTLTRDEELPARYAVLSCIRSDLNSTFTGLVADLAALIESEPDRAPTLIVRTLHAWRLLFGTASGRWTVPRLAGLFAELTVLEELVNRSPGAVRTWLGPLGCPQDFRGVHHALEVKGSVTAYGRVVHIHGLDQLESPPQGSLSLAWFRVAESTAASARSVPQLLAACRDRVTDLSALETRLLALGLPVADDGVVAQSRFLVTEQRWYEVTEDFPRLVPQSLVGSALPSGIREVEYQVDLDTVSSIIDREQVLVKMGDDL